MSLFRNVNLILPKKYNLVNQNILNTPDMNGDGAISPSENVNWQTFTKELIEAINYCYNDSTGKVRLLLSKVTLDINNADQIVNIVEHLGTLSLELQFEFLIAFFKKDNHTDANALYVFLLKTVMRLSDNPCSDFIAASRIKDQDTKKQESIIRAIIPFCDPDFIEFTLNQLELIELFHLTALAWYNKGNFEKAALVFRSANMNDASDVSQLTYANILKKLSDYDAAYSIYKSLCSKYSENRIIHESAGYCLMQLEKWCEADRYYKAALMIEPNDLKILINLGIVNTNLNAESAIKYFQRALEIDPQNYLSLIGMANIYISLNDLANARLCLNIIDSKEQHIGAEYFVNWSVIYRREGDTNKELSTLKEGLIKFPKDPLLLEYYGLALRTRGFRIQSNKCFDKAIHFGATRFNCFYERFRNAVAGLEYEIVSEFLQNDQYHGIPSEPFTYLSVVDDGLFQLEKASMYAREQTRNICRRSLDIVPTDKIKVCYVSADFHDHATMHLMSGLLRCHNHDQFEIFLFSNGPKREDQYRQLCMKHCTEFVDISEMSDQKVLDLSDQLGINIAIDLKGYTLGSRQALFAKGLAPIQLSYLGYPGTSGASYIDYIIADKVVVKDENYFSEKIIYMPNSYQCNDDERPLPDKFSSKEDYGLPNDKFIFASFNNPSKICVNTWALWIEILQNCPNSVLWLLVNDEDMKSVIMDRLSSSGIKSDRVIFASRVDHIKHLERHYHVDLMLDTLVYNAHTTASDALWMGCPIISLPGDSFASRVAASLLTACNLSLLVCKSRESLISRCYSLYRGNKKLSVIKKHLRDKRRKFPLFNTEEFTCDFEANLIKLLV